MNRLHILLLAGAAVLWASAADTASAQSLADRRAARHAQGMSWHGPYYNTEWGAPIPLVVPPTAHMQTKWAWGVSQGTMTPIYHQYRRGYPGDYEFGGMEMYPTPRWPSHSDQFGIYYIRGPW